MKANYTESDIFDKLVRLFNKYGIDKDRCIELLETFNKRHRYTIESFYSKSVDLIDFLIEKGIKEDKIGSVMTRFYPIFTYDKDFFNKNIEHLLDFGFTKEDINKMIVLSPSILAISDKVDVSFKYLDSLGYSKEDIIDMSKKAPAILTHSVDYIERRIAYFKSKGMNDEEALRALKRAPTLISFSNKVLDEKINDLVKIGFDRQAVYSILRVNPSILCYTKESIMERINTLIDLGFTKEESIRLYSYQKTLFTTKPETIKDKIKVLRECKYSLDNVQSIVSKYPGVTGLNSDSIKDKITFYDSLGLHNIIVREPKHLMQSLTLSKARSRYFEENGMAINESNYRRLFMGEKVFAKQFHRTNQDILERYGSKE